MAGKAVGNKGWFHTPGRTGDRTLDQQLNGLDRLLGAVHGKTALDVGCAEGLISIEMAKAGAVAVHGVEIVAAHVAVGNKLRGDLPITFEVGDANVWRPRRHYDVIAMLALLQKVKDPTRVCAEIVEFAREMVVLRLPPKHAPTVIDDRSGNQPHHIGETMKRAGFYLEHAGYDGAFGEWVGNYRRVK